MLGLASYGARSNVTGIDVSAGNTAFNATSKVAVSAWYRGGIYSGSDPGTTDIVSHQNAGAASDAYVLGFDGSNNGFQLKTFNGATATIYANIVTMRRLGYMRWVHILIIANGTDVIHYTNGVHTRRTAQSANFTANQVPMRTKIMTQGLPFGSINGDAYDVRIWAQNDVDVLGPRSAAEIMRGTSMGETGRFFAAGANGVDLSQRGNNLVSTCAGSTNMPPRMAQELRGGPWYRYHRVDGLASGTIVPRIMNQYRQRSA